LIEMKYTQYNTQVNECGGSNIAKRISSPANTQLLAAMAAAMKAMKVMKKKAAMKVMKKKAAMKVMKKKAVMKAMKRRRAMKKISARLAKRHAFAGKIAKTATGLKKSDLVKNKHGKVVSKKMSAKGKTNKWIVACNKARAALKIKGFVIIKKGTPLYKKAKELMK
jgi:hypothetical protein